MESFEKTLEQQLVETQELLRQSETRVTELEEENARLKNDFMHDPLTGLKTRHFLLEQVHELLITTASPETGNRRHTFNEEVGFIFCDIDKFKNFNDIYGHDIGDAVLHMVSRVLMNGVRGSDIVSRWGGEEIVIALKGSTIEDTHEKAEELRKKIALARLTEEDFPAIESRPELKDLSVTISLGLSSSSEELNLGVGELVARADKAMYAAKEGGRNKVVRLPTK
jgi:diguanylate cyclase (GGDEF)-like protein